MKLKPSRNVLAALVMLSLTAWFDPQPAAAQSYGYRPYPYGPRITLVPLQRQLDQFQRTCRMAPGYYTQGGYDMVWQQFQALRSTYAAFQEALSPNQAYEGGNDLADLDAGLDIIQKAFTRYQNNRAATYPASASFDSLCKVLSRSVTVWSLELQEVFNRLRSVRG
jgi:hypothetical protein